MKSSDHRDAPKSPGEHTDRIPAPGAFGCPLPSQLSPMARDGICPYTAAWYRGDLPLPILNCISADGRAAQGAGSPVCTGNIISQTHLKNPLKNHDPRIKNHTLPDGPHEKTEEHTGPVGPATGEVRVVGGDAHGLAPASGLLRSSGMPAAAARFLQRLSFCRGFPAAAAGGQARPLRRVSLRPNQAVVFGRLIQFFLSFGPKIPVFCPKR